MGGAPIPGAFRGAEPPRIASPARPLPLTAARCAFLCAVALSPVPLHCDDVPRRGRARRQRIPGAVLAGFARHGQSSREHSCTRLCADIISFMSDEQVEAEPPARRTDARSKCWEAAREFRGAVVTLYPSATKKRELRLLCFLLIIQGCRPTFKILAFPECIQINLTVVSARASRA